MDPTWRRANATNQSGNALVSFRLHECRFLEPGKHQAYSIISLSGEVVKLSRSSKHKAAAEKGVLRLNAISKGM
jgi:hypothetical protein